MPLRRFIACEVSTIRHTATALLAPSIRAKADACVAGAGPLRIYAWSAHEVHNRFNRWRRPASGNRGRWTPSSMPRRRRAEPDSHAAVFKLWFMPSLRITLHPESPHQSGRSKVIVHRRYSFSLLHVARGLSRAAAGRRSGVSIVTAAVSLRFVVFEERCLGGSYSPVL